MSSRTIAALVIVIALTVIIMQNPEPVNFTLLFDRVTVPKLVVLTAVSAAGFMLGLLLGIPRSKAGRTPYPADEEGTPERRHDTLSDEDRDYISEP